MSHLPCPVNTREQDAASPSTIDQARGNTVGVPGLVAQNDA
jgi:hypothetical protein